MVFIQKNKWESRKIKREWSLWGQSKVHLLMWCASGVQVMCTSLWWKFESFVKYFISGPPVITGMPLLQIEDLGFCSREIIDVWKSRMLFFLMWSMLPINRTESTWYDAPSIYKCSRESLNMKGEQCKSLILSFIPYHSYYFFYLYCENFDLSMNSQRSTAFPPRQSLTTWDPVQECLNIGTALTSFKSTYYSTKQDNL